MIGRVIARIISNPDSTFDTILLQDLVIAIDGID